MAVIEKAQKSAIGVVIQVTILEDGVAVDVSTVTTKQIIFRKPDGPAVTKTASFVNSGTDGKLKYTTIAGDLNESGLWDVQGYVVFAGGFDGRSDITQFEVEDNLA